MHPYAENTPSAGGVFPPFKGEHLGLAAGSVVRVGPFTSTVMASLDFETYSEAGYVWNGTKWESPPGLSAQNRGLKAVGTYNYVTHPTFRVLVLNYDLKDGRGVRRWVPPADPILHPPYPPDLLEHIEAGKPISARNSLFEFIVWNHGCVPRWNWPELKLEQLFCSMAKSRVAAYPASLGDAGDVLQLPAHLRKDPAGDKLIRKLTVPRNPTKGNSALRWTPITAPEDFEAFYRYGEQDVVAESAINDRTPDLSPRELEYWRLDQRINYRGMHVDRQGVENCIAIRNQAYAKYNAELRELTNGAVENSSEVQKILEWMRTKHFVRILELDEDSVAAELERNHHPKVLRALRIRQLLAFGSVKKLDAMRAQMGSDGRIRDQYVYAGAHTMLWNGRSVQPANLYKGRFSHPEQVELALSVIASRSLEAVETAYGDALEVVADCLRSLITAAPGKKLISTDFTAIQAVVTSCLAGEQWRIDTFATHGKIYESMASKLTGKPLEYYIQYKKEHGKHHEDRQLGKLATLSGDFGAWLAGWKRFGAEKYGDDEYIQKLILLTRAAMPNIVEFWGGQTRNRYKRDERAELYGLEGAAISAVLSPGQCYAYRGVAYQMIEDVLYCQGPSGGLMRYHSPRLTPSQREHARPWELELSYEGWNSNATKGRPGWQRMKLYGGLLTQNVVARESREPQACALLALDQSGYPIVMHTHDEQVGEPDDDPKWNAEDFTRIVRDSLPAWATLPNGQPWPIKVPPAWEAYRYGKWEI